MRCLKSLPVGSSSGPVPRLESWATRGDLDHLSLYSFVLWRMASLRLDPGLGLALGLSALFLFLATVTGPALSHWGLPPFSIWH